MEFTKDEKYFFLRMIDYFIRSEREEIKELKCPSGKDEYVLDCEKRLRIFQSIKKKVKTKFNF